MSRHVRPVALAAPLLASGALMAAYLLARPYGDSHGGDTLAAAEAFASPLWTTAHLAGAAALCALAAAWARAATGWPRWASVTGVALALPYYGAETFALHEIGARALAGDPGALELVAAVRDNPVGMTLFGVGLLALAAGGVGAALRSGARGALLPLAVVAALFLPQFFLPPVGRIAYGVLFAAVAAYAAYAAYAARATRATPAGITAHATQAEHATPSTKSADQITI